MKGCLSKQMESCERIEANIFDLTRTSPYKESSIKLNYKLNGYIIYSLISNIKYFKVELYIYIYIDILSPIESIARLGT